MVSAVDMSPNIVRYTKSFLAKPHWTYWVIATVMREVRIQYTLEGFNGSLLKENVFRQDAGPEVDAAWESLGVNCVFW